MSCVLPVDSIPPVIAYDKNGLKSMIHFTSNKPRADVQVLVLSTLSTNSKPVNNFIFQAAVPKVIVKLAGYFIVTAFLYLLAVYVLHLKAVLHSSIRHT